MELFNMSDICHKRVTRDLQTVNINLVCTNKHIYLPANTVANITTKKKHFSLVVFEKDGVRVLRILFVDKTYPGSRAVMKICHKYSQSYRLSVPNSAAEELKKYVDSGIYTKLYFGLEHVDVTIN